MAVDLSAYARAVPLVAHTAHGFGPLATGGRFSRSLKKVAGSREGVWIALDSIGLTERRLIGLIALLGGSATLNALEAQTKGADREVIDAALDRLATARLVDRGRDGTVALAAAVREFVGDPRVSMGDPNATTTEQLALICRHLGVKAPSKKADRIAAIADVFIDPHRRELVRAELSSRALALLDDIVDVAGTGTVPAAALGLPSYLLSYGEAPRFNYSRPQVVPDEVAALRELTVLGIVGLTTYEPELWIWREAWPFVDRPFVTNWTTAPVPEVGPVEPGAVRLPAIVSALDQVLRTWQLNPPDALKNGKPRVAKNIIRSAAKTIGVDAELLDLAVRLAISTGLLLSNVVARGGRGRKSFVHMVWMEDTTMVESWNALSPLDRWVRLVAEWCQPQIECGHQLLVNRHLLLWELLHLDAGQGYIDDDGFASWFADRHSSLGHAGAVAECLADLRVLGVVMPGTVALTLLGRAVLTDPASVHDAVGSEADTFIVQADLTVIAPPDLRPDLVEVIEAVATLESDAGALTYRLDPLRITRAVQAGQTAAEIVASLEAASTAGLPDTVVRLIVDAAERAGSVKVIAAPTVVVVSDAVDLTTACGLKSLKLTKVTDTVAITEVPIAKVQAALAKKGLSPEAVVGGTWAPITTTDQAEQLARQAAQMREMADRHRSRPGMSDSYYEREARSLEAQAKAMADVDGRLSVTGPLTVTPAMVEASARSRT